MTRTRVRNRKTKFDRKLSANIEGKEKVDENIEGRRKTKTKKKKKERKGKIKQRNK